MDGLGAIPLRAHAGHARRLTAAMTKKDVLSSVFLDDRRGPHEPAHRGGSGRHGLVGYEVRDPGTGPS
jgi:hypothetical protein